MAAATLWLTRMSAADKIGQMTQLDISMVLADGCPLRIDDAKLRRQLRVHRLGSLLNSPFSGTDPRCGSSGWNASEWRASVEHVQAAAADEASAAAAAATALPESVGMEAAATSVEEEEELPVALALAAALALSADELRAGS